MSDESPPLVPRAINLGELIEGFPYITPAGGANMAQAAIICFDHNQHASGVQLATDGDFSTLFEIQWSEPITTAMRRFWNDLEEATKEGACGLAILLIRALTGYTVIERSKKGTGVDWWLGTDDELFQHKARLEVSGILRGDATAITQRMSVKKRQSKQSDTSQLPAYIVVVEFSMPRSRVVQR